jgi:hypothetical protein
MVPAREGAFIKEHKRLHLDILEKINHDHALLDTFEQ